MVKGGVRRSVWLKNVKRSDGTVNGRDNADTLEQFLQNNINLLLLGTYLWIVSVLKLIVMIVFGVLSRATSRRHLEVLESVYF